MIVPVLLTVLLAHVDSPQLPVPLEIRVPEYPEIAVKAQMAQVVEVEEIVASDGSVSSTAVRGNPLPPLGDAALRAAREWKFNGVTSPALRKYVIRFEFTVDSEPATQGGCFMGPQSVTIFLPLQTVRIRGWLRYVRTTVN
jgi:TonB family protein